ncbi:MAG: hypothetical protein V9F06_00190 [Thermomicrobiales bacterium]
MSASSRSRQRGFIDRERSSPAARTREGGELHQKRVPRVPLVRPQRSGTPWRLSAPEAREHAGERECGRGLHRASSTVEQRAR